VRVLVELWVRVPGQHLTMRVHVDALLGRVPSVCQGCVVHKCVCVCVCVCARVCAFWCRVRALTAHTRTHAPAASHADRMHTPCTPHAHARKPQQQHGTPRPTLPAVCCSSASRLVMSWPVARSRQRVAVGGGAWHSAFYVKCCVGPVEACDGQHRGARAGALATPHNSTTHTTPQTNKQTIKQPHKVLTADEDRLALDGREPHLRWHRVAKPACARVRVVGLSGRSSVCVRKEQVSGSLVMARAVGVAIRL
jgi:hypothetical protein